MKKANLFMTILVVLMGVLTTNAQGETLPYLMMTDNIENETVTVTDGWNLSYTGSYDPNSTYDPKAAYFFADNLGFNTLVFEKYFDFTNSSNVNISFEFLKHFSSSAQIGYRIEIDNNQFYYNLTETEFTGAFDLTSNDLNLLTTPSNTLVKISVEFQNQSVSFVGSIGYLEINHTPINTSGIPENELSENLEVYSYGKSVFITANENMNTAVTVYNMNGQVVYSENVELSLSKTELNLYDVNTGMYIISITDGSSVMQKKVYIQ